LSVSRPAEEQTQSYQITYDVKPQRPTYNRPAASFVDQNVDRQNGYRYRNYNPHTNGQSYRNLFDSHLMKPNRRLLNQQPFMPVNAFGSIREQQPVNDYDFQQPRMLAMQDKLQRSMLRDTQPSAASQFVSNLNTPSRPASSYGR